MRSRWRFSSLVVRYAFSFRYSLISPSGYESLGKSSETSTRGGAVCVFAPPAPPAPAFFFFLGFLFFFFLAAPSPASAAPSSASLSSSESSALAALSPFCVVPLVGLVLESSTARCQ